ncbi:MAG: DUF368 domain-containing protein [Halodesulfurarchaeum sp.]
MGKREWVVVYLKGFAMGSADAIPGVSGGTIALITGIYDRLVGAIANIDRDGVFVLLTSALRAYSTEDRIRGLERAFQMDLPFLFVLAFGVVSAAVTAANVILVGITEFPGPTYAFFFGLIAASVYVLRDEMTIDSSRGVLVAFVGFVLAFVLSGSFDGSFGDGLLVVFLSGAIAICAMVLPGISGSLILLALGQYELMVETVHRLTDAVLNGAGSEIAAPLAILVVFATGALLGLLSFARVVSWALETYRRETLTFLIALMVGALRAPGEEILAATSVWTPTVSATLVIAAIVGGGLVVLLDSMTAGIEY